MFSHAKYLFHHFTCKIKIIFELGGISVTIITYIIWSYHNLETIDTITAFIIWEK